MLRLPAIVAAFLAFGAPVLPAQSSFYDQALEAFKTREYPRALTLLKQAEQKGVMGADEWNLRGSIHMRLRDFAAARDAFRRAVRADPTLWAAQFNLGEADFREGNFAASRSAFERLLLNSTADGERDLARYKIALTFIKDGDLARATEAIDRLKPGGSPSYFFARAALALHQHAGAEAARWLEKAPGGPRAPAARVFADSFEAMGWSADPRLAARLGSPTGTGETLGGDWTVAGFLGSPTTASTATPPTTGLATPPPATSARAANVPRNEPPVSDLVPIADSVGALPPAIRAGTPPPDRSAPPPRGDGSTPAGLRRAQNEALPPASGPAGSAGRKVAPAPTPEFLEAFLAAAQAYQRKDYDEAAGLIEKADGVQPGQADSLNLRGLIRFRLRDYPAAEAFFRGAIQADPTLWAAKFNLAEIPFEFRNYSLARARYEQLYLETDATTQPREVEFTQYKIFLTLLLEGKEQMARTFMGRFRFNSPTPARSYAQAALNFRAGDFEKGASWIANARREFPADANAMFAEAFYRIGWLTEAVVAPEPAVLAGDGFLGDGDRVATPQAPGGAGLPADVIQPMSEPPSGPPLAAMAPVSSEPTPVTPARLAEAAATPAAPRASASPPPPQRAKLRTAEGFSWEEGFPLLLAGVILALCTAVFAFRRRRQGKRPSPRSGTHGRQPAAAASETGRKI